MLPATPFLESETYAALLFDCDGTLVDTAPAHFFAYNEALRPLGLALESAWYEDRFGLTPQALLTELSAFYGMPFDIPKTIDEYSKHFQLRHDLLQEIAVVAEIARANHGRVPMAVASNGARANVERTLAVTGLRPLFDLVVAVEDVAQGKPAPDLYLEAARRLGVAPEHCIVFEDTEPGFAAARAAGMRVRDIRDFSR